MEPRHAARKDRPDLNALWRKATEYFGLSATYPVCQRIQHLSGHWNDAIYASVLRAFENLHAARNALPRVGDRIPPPDAFQGELLVALVMMLTGGVAPVHVPVDRLALHAIVAGLPGMGKTYFCRLLFTQISKMCPHVRVMILDPNRSYASMATDPHSWLSIPWDRLKLGLFTPPPGYALDRWLAETNDLLSRGELLHSRYLVQDLLNTLVDTAVKSAVGGPVTLPSLLCLRDALASLKCKPWSPDERYRLSALNVVTGRIASTGNVFDCSAGMEPLLTDTRARISTEGLAPIESLQFVVTHLLHYACRRRETAPLTEPPTLHTLILIEEAQTLLQKSGENITYYQELLLRARALGVGFVFVCQDISRIDPIILAACSNHFVFGQASADDKATCQKVLDLSARETSLLGELPLGEAFIRFTGHPNFPWAFHARIPDVRLT